MIPKVSVIVPIFNMEEYLDRSLNSLLSQKLKDMEFILVNDGSVDRSLEICYKYKAIDSRFKLINQTNKGVSAARNAGIIYAKGEFIGFLDPDDALDEKMYLSLYNKVSSTNSDIGLCNMVVERENQIIKELVISSKKDIVEGEEILDSLVVNMLATPKNTAESNIIMASVCRTLIKRELIEENKLSFNEDISYMEDLIFLVSALKYSSKVTLLKEANYRYISRHKSAVNTYKIDLYEKSLSVFYELESILKVDLKKENINERMNLRYLEMCLSVISNELYHNKSKGYLEVYRKMLYLFKRDEKLKYILNEFDFSGIQIKKYVFLLILKYLLKFN